MSSNDEGMLEENAVEFQVEAIMDGRSDLSAETPWCMIVHNEDEMSLVKECQILHQKTTWCMIEDEM